MFILIIVKGWGRFVVYFECEPIWDPSTATTTTPAGVFILTPLHLETLFWKKNDLELVLGGVLGALKGLCRRPLWSSR